MTDTESPSFTKDHAAVKALADRRSMDLAYEAARKLVRDFPEEPEAWFILNYTVCVGNKAGGARFMSPHIIREAEAHFADSFDPRVQLVIGDAKRDRAIGLIRYRLGEEDLKLAETIVAKLRGTYKGELEDGEVIGEHKDDPNRLAALLDVEGRALYARRRYIAADRKHSDAHRAWHAIGDLADPVWIYNNELHWLKTLVKLGYRHSTEAQDLIADIKRGCPGSRNRRLEATIILLPFVGNRIHDRLTRRR